MKSKITIILIAACADFMGATASFNAYSQPAASALSAVSAMPVASVVGASAVGASVVVPVALSTAGAVLVVKSVELSATGTVYVLERVSDGAQVSIEVSANVAGAASVVAGTLVAVSVIAADTVLSVAGEAIAFIPNEIGRALLHNERVRF